MTSTRPRNFLSRPQKIGFLLAIPPVLLAVLDQLRPRESNNGAFVEKQYEKAQTSALKALISLKEEHRFARRLTIRWVVHFKNADGFYSVIYEKSARKIHFAVKFRGSDPFFNDDWHSDCARVTEEKIAQAALKNDFSGLVFGDGCTDNFPRPS